MGQNEKVEKATKTSWFSGLKAEFQKIIWPEKHSVIRQTVAVLAVSVVTGLITVSYTHLDVYKRQGIAGSEGIGIGNVVISEEHEIVIENKKLTDTDLSLIHI